jgi:hypothetical protein
MGDHDDLAGFAQRGSGLTRRRFGLAMVGAGVVAGVPRLSLAAETQGKDVEIKTSAGTAEAYFVHPATGAGLAAHFGTVGLGSETGFSIRTPTSDSNLYGLSTTSGPISRTGQMWSYITGERGGPMAHNVYDLEILGRPWSEPTLIKLASGFEAATDNRRVPKSTPALPGETIRY